jgi:hypothetical protein
MSRPLVVIASGHMIDAPDRPCPRFPEGEVPRVAAAIARTFDEWGVDAGTTLISGGARGADIMAAEAALARGASVIVCLPLQVDDFIKASVRLPGDRSWVERFEAVAERSQVRPPHDLGGRADSEGVFALNNSRMIELANAMSSGSPHVLGVWDGRSGDGPGGTADVLARCGTGRHERIRVIDPTPRHYEPRQTSLGPKRLLALDGGGTRGMLTLGVLAGLESGLRAAGGDEQLVLSDVYDYIGGTGTGAVIATGLALGMPVEELERHYRKLARKVFSKRILPERLRSSYREAPTRKHLMALLGDGRTLGDPDFRSLLLVVLHNTSTDSPWLLSNCTGATYNLADRYAAFPSDRNLDFDLAAVVRGSTAAPLWYAPEDIEVGDHVVTFQDGGITPFSNPAFALFTVATLPEYGLGWATGVDRLLLTSVGAGCSAAEHPAPGGRDAQVNAKNLSSVVMNGAAFGQDLVCRTVGQCRTGPALDDEVGDRIGVPPVGGAGLFAYQRYDADLSLAALARRGIADAEHQRAVCALDGVDALDDLWSIGRAAGSDIDVEADFAGYL